MIPVTQDIFYDDPQGRMGNCFQAAIAAPTTKEAVWRTVVNFIKWYNQNNN